MEGRQIVGFRAKFLQAQVDGFFGISTPAMTNRQHIVPLAKLYLARSAAAVKCHKDYLHHQTNISQETGLIQSSTKGGLENNGRTIQQRKSSQFRVRRRRDGSLSIVFYSRALAWITLSHSRATSAVRRTM